MCRTLYVAKTANIGYTTSMGAEEIRVPSRGMRQTDVHMGREAMGRYIDADALIMALRLEYPMIPMFKENQKEWEIKTDGYRKAEEVIKDAPSIDIVRCKECKYYKQSEAFCENGNGLWQAGDECFCSYGERRSDG